jgi:hypothetical protein
LFADFDFDFDGSEAVFNALDDQEVFLANGPNSPGSPRKVQLNE